MSSHTSHSSGTSDANPDIHITGYSAASLPHPQIHIDDDEFMDPIEMFLDPLDDDSSDMGSFGVDEMYGSDSDAEVIIRRPWIEEQPSSSDDKSVCFIVFIHSV
jgi:hypothetical protein